MILVDNNDIYRIGGIWTVQSTIEWYGKLTGNQQKLEETKEDLEKIKKMRRHRSDFYKENKGGRYQQNNILEDNNTDLSSYL